MTFLMKILQGLMLKHVYILLILNFPLNFQTAIYPLSVTSLHLFRFTCSASALKLIITTHFLQVKSSLINFIKSIRWHYWPPPFLLRFLRGEYQQNLNISLSKQFYQFINDMKHFKGFYFCFYSEVLFNLTSKPGSDVKSRSTIVEEEVDIMVSASQRPLSNLT